MNDLSFKENLSFICGLLTVGCLEDALGPHYNYSTSLVRRSRNLVSNSSFMLVLKLLQKELAQDHQSKKRSTLLNDQHILRRRPDDDTFHTKFRV